MTADKQAQIQRVLEPHPSILAAYLHGSTAKETARPGSDVDIALLPQPGKHISLKTRLEYAGNLEAILGCPVDLGELSTRNLVYAKEVIVNGKEIFTANRFQSDLFMATAPQLDSPTHADALTLNIERACQAAIDMAMHLVGQRHLGVPQNSAEAFGLLGARPED